MSTVKNEVRTMLDDLPEDCTIEDIQYHLYVREKIARGIERADNEGTTEQHEVEKEFSAWTD